MTNVMLIIVFDGQQYKIPFLNTKLYFEEAICFAMNKGNRLLYLPLQGNPSQSSGFPYSLCLNHNNQKYYFITTQKNRDPNLMVSMALKCTWSDRSGAGGFLDVSIGNQILGLKFKLHFRHKSGDYCCEDFDMEISHGSAFLSKDVTFANSLVSYNEVKTVTCDISDTVFDINLYADEIGYVWDDEFTFDISE